MSHVRWGSLIAHCGGSMALRAEQRWQNRLPQKRQWWRRSTRPSKTTWHERPVQRCDARSSIHAGGVGGHWRSADSATTSVILCLSGAESDVVAFLLALSTAA